MDVLNTRAHVCTDCGARCDEKKVYTINEQRRNGRLTPVGSRLATIYLCETCDLTPAPRQPPPVETWPTM